MSPTLDPHPFVDGVERSIETLLRAIDRGHHPTREAVEAVRVELGRLPRTDGSIPSWRLAALDAAMQDLVRRGVPSSLQVPFVPAPRDSEKRAQASPRTDDIAGAFDALRRRVDALHDLVEVGRKPTSKTFDDLHADLVAHRQRADGAEIRQMIADVRGFRRATLAAARPTTPPRLASSRAGRGFWGTPMAEGGDPAGTSGRRRGVALASPLPPPRASSRQSGRGSPTSRAVSATVLHALRRPSRED